MTASVIVFGSTNRAAATAAALRRAGWHVESATPSTARRAVGSAAGARLAVLVWPPGTHPDIEMAVFLTGTPALHIHWSATHAEVGPLLDRRVGPCPRCLAAEAVRRPRGTRPAIAAWATATAALEATTILTSGRTACAGASVVWTDEHPALAGELWASRPDCTAPVCAQP